MSEKKITNEDVTNKDVLEFYADKGEDGCRLTEKYIEKHPTDKKYIRSNPYVRLIKVFKNEEGTEEDKEFYEWLKNQDISKMRSLSKVADSKLFTDFIWNPECNDPLREKWHLYIAFYAFEEYLDDLSSKDLNEGQPLTENSFMPGSAEILNRQRNHSHSLWLWMYEASEPDMESELYKKAEDAVCNGSLMGLISFFKEEIEKKIKKWKESRTEQDN